MGTARSNTSKAADVAEDKVADVPDGESVKDVADGLSADPSIVDEVAAGLEGLGIDPADVDVDRLNTNTGHPTFDLGDTARSSVRVEDLASYPTLEQHVLENYQQLKADRGWTWEQVAASVQDADPRLAAYFREAGDQLDAPPRSTSVGSFETR